MAKIILHTPMHLSDYKTTTEFEANDIGHIWSKVYDDNKKGTSFNLKNDYKEYSCSESANVVKRMVEENKTEEKPFVIQSGKGNAIAIGVGNQVVSGKEENWSVIGVIATLVIGAVGIVLTVILTK